LPTLHAPPTDARGRFRQIPTFGTDTIRRFSNNVSEMKQLAAQDFEDLLQVLHLDFDDVDGAHKCRI
jgi:hypothetical protein